ncbi:MAG: ABC transporter permease [Anaerolineae bacterium]|jgi:putative ABC transport system permease protein
MTEQQRRPEQGFASRTLWNVGWRSLLRRPWQSVLMVLGIALGVAVVVAVDLANASARQAFTYSTDAVAGRATHQIVAGPQGLDQAVYVDLRRAGAVDAAAPIVTEYVTSPELDGQPVQLLGIDPFAEPPFRDYLWSDDGGVPIDTLTDLLTQPGALLISTGLAERYGLAPEDEVTLEIAGYERRAHIAGLLAPRDSLSRRALSGIVLADIATAQELTGRMGRLDRVDLILPDDGGRTRDRIAAQLPQDARIGPAEARSGTIEEMTAAFRVNLTALSLLALVVGLFLIYNTMTFSVIQRRSLFGTLRCLGVTRREVFTLVLGEALIVGTLGAGIGLGLGILMGQEAVRLVTQTINDLYFVVTVRGIAAAPSSLVKGGLLGLVATAGAASLPAWEAASVPPRVALSRSGLESKAQHLIGWIALGGLALVACGTLVLLLPTQSLVVSFAGTAAVVVGFAMLTPLITRLVMRVATPLMARIGGALGRMAPRNVVNSLSRTSVAVAALMVSVSVTIGIGLMISSFRHTVQVWLSQALRGDIYISTASLAGTQSLAPIDDAAIDLVERWPGVERVDRWRFTAVGSPEGRAQVSAIINPNLGTERVYLPGSEPPETIWPAMLDGAVIVSEPYARRIGLPRSGGTVTLYTDRGPHTFPVVGIYYDYTTSEGIISMSLDTYRQFWDDDRLTALSLRLPPEVDVDAVAQEVQAALVPIQDLVVRPNRALRDDVLVVFDRTFAITGALQLLATVVAFIGVLSAMLSLQLEKARELGILRAVGLTVRQLWALGLMETGLMGTVAGLLAMPTGLVLALILIYVINRRAFGWTLLLEIDPGLFLQSLGIAVVAALLAGVYPAYRMGKMLTAEALRYE